MPNPHGRYPRSSALKKYIESTKHYYAPSTQAERERKIRYVLTVMESLGAPHCPSKVEEKHIFAFLDWMETRSLTGETKRKLLRFLRDFLAFHDNEVINKLLSRKQIRMPKNIRDQNFRSLPMDIVETIHTATHHIDGWEGSIARFITLAYPYTGLRPSELRTMEFRDIDLPSWTLVVSHPKGEGLYGQHRRVPIAFQVRPAFSKFLTERKEYLKQNGYSENEIPLIPHIGKKGVTVWTHQQFLKIKSGIEQVSGIEFKLKDYRTTFCQYTIDMGADISAVSKIMGHKTTMTTELFYGRIRNDDAITEINRVFMEPGILKVNSRVN
jgi:site-specific recombinase XerD